jgi:hypothetical protein
MPRKRKQDVKVNNTESLEGLMQETYNDACLQINDVQRTINELTTGANPDGVDDLTKVASLPFTIIDTLNRKGIMRGFAVIDEKEFRRFLNDPENRFFRTRPGIV